jgi:hypothetical protein
MSPAAQDLGRRLEALTARIHGINEQLLGILRMLEGPPPGKPSPTVRKRPRLELVSQTLPRSEEFGRRAA